MPIQPRSRSPPNQEWEKRPCQATAETPQDPCLGCCCLGVEMEAAEAQASRQESGQLPVGFGESVIGGERPSREAGGRRGRWPWC